MNMNTKDTHAQALLLVIERNGSDMLAIPLAECSDTPISALLKTAQILANDAEIGVSDISIRFSQ